MRQIRIKALAVGVLIAVMSGMAWLGFLQYRTHEALLQTEIKVKQIRLDELNGKSGEMKKQTEQLIKEKQELEKQLQSKREEAKKIADSKVQVTQVAVASSGGCDELRNKMANLGVSGANLDAAITLAKRESSCNAYAVNGSGGACGYFQSLPCGKWGAPGTDQYLLGAINYANSRYGSYLNALAHSYANNWY